MEGVIRIQFLPTVAIAEKKFVSNGPHAHIRAALFIIFCHIDFGVKGIMIVILIFRTLSKKFLRICLSEKVRVRHDLGLKISSSKRDIEDLRGKFFD
ncbi:hypothetical protein KIN20_021467 [Parelaphostrongylus tenuis]|uniref:Transmembrane protein n=1 Tax=Parelaphostrongylus tenuis TaxID=148309 RepID=A0AAD5MNY7_PARTN|nr:hypothetical protein KIN20_021467 [Parelaphostrongylus tenuis]